MILREASSPAALGAVIGVAVAALLTRYVQTMLFGVQPLDPVTLTLAVTLMLAVAILAGWLPAPSRVAPRSDGGPSTRVASVSIQYVSTRRNVVTLAASRVKHNNFLIPSAYSVEV